MKTSPALLEILKSAYPCSGFAGACRSMRWDPLKGHIPRGFLGATGELSEVELVLVFAEPGNPHPGDHQTMEEALVHAYHSFKTGRGVFHQKARAFFDLCWPGLTFEDQLRRVWVTESVLCSAEWSTGPVAREVEMECGARYLIEQLKLFPNAMVVALGSKAKKRLSRLGLHRIHSAYAFGLPGCNKEEALPSWVRISEHLNVIHTDRLEPEYSTGIPILSPLPETEKNDNNISTPMEILPMTRERKTLTREEAGEYTSGLERKAAASGIDLDRWVLGLGKANDIRAGKGPRHAIVATAQEWAAKGATYGNVLGLTVIQGDGQEYRIRTHDLAGFVCANGYCTILPPPA